MNGHGYPRYDQYKASGVEWFPSIPAHWNVTRLKNIASVRLSNVDKKSEDGEPSVRLCNYTDVYKHDSITPDMPFMEATASVGQIGRFALLRDDVLVTKDSETPDDIAVPSWVSCDLPGVLCGYHLALVRPHRDCIDGRYLARSFAAVGPRDQFHTSALGITRFGLAGDAITSSLHCVPSLAEQRAIADFLDRETARIDALIEKQEQLIEKLEEKRKAVIARAVTRGLDPKVRVKESGVVWLGKVPAHWEVKRLKHLIPAIDQGTSPQCDSCPAAPGEWGVLKAGCVNNGIFRPQENKRVPRDYPINAAMRVYPGDVLMSRANGNPELVGSCAIVGEATSCLLLSDKTFRLRMANGVCPAFIYYLLNAHFVRCQILLETSGAEGLANNITKAAIKNLLVGVPREEEEQHAISLYLDVETERIGMVAAKTRELVAKLREKRTALISAAVTGRIKVNGQVAIDKAQMRSEVVHG